jgi:hypothetical protein
MKDKKHTLRLHFRDAVFERDGHRCRMCGFKPDPASIYNNEENESKVLDAHHIINRRDMPNGGYVLQNGISLCPDCHLKAEQFHSTGGVSFPGYSPEDLYKAIGSSKELAESKSHECLEIHGKTKV